MTLPTGQLGDPTEPTSQTPAYADDLYCPDCGYSLRGLTSERCPECGLLLDFIESGVPLIPWERRRELGRLRAYWQTVQLVMFRTKLFCRAAYRPVSYRDAQAFRWVTILHVYIPVLLALGVVHLLYPDLLPLAADETGWWFVIFACGCVLLTLLALTGVPSYFFQPRYLTTEQQNRAIALSYYGCAPWLWTPAVLFVGVLGALTFEAPKDRGQLVIGSLAMALLACVVVLWIGLMTLARRVVPRWLVTLALLPLAVVSVSAMVIARQAPKDLGPVLMLLTTVLVIAEVLACWLNLTHIARCTLRRPLAVVRVMLLVPLSWGLVGLLVLVGLPLVAYCVALVFYSLRSGGLSG